MTHAKSARNKPRRAGRRARVVRPRQLELALPRGRGGARPGAGRPRSGKSYVAHRTRPRLSRDEPILITIRLVRRLPRLRGRRPFEVIERALRATNERGGLRLVHYSVQDDHLHLMAEARPEEAPAGTVPRAADSRRRATRLVTSRMRGFGVRLARRLNKLFGRRGQLIAERYHAQALTTPRAVRNALVYLFGNRRKHLAKRGRTFPGGWIDPFASGVFFLGWRSPPDWMTSWAHHDPPPVVSPRTWLLRCGWLRHGAVAPADVPAGAHPRASEAA